MNCVLAKWMQCDGYQAQQQMPRLARAVRRLCSAADCAETPADSGTEASMADALQSSTDTLLRVAASLDMQRLARVADEDALRDAQRELASLDAQAAAQAAAQDALLQKAQQDMKTEADKRKALALSLIKFRDQLMYFQENFDAVGNPQAVEMLKNLYAESGRFMKENRIEPLEDTGVLDAQRHTVVDTRPTDDPALENSIAQTFRAGYRLDGNIVRPQEVVVYTKANR